MTISDKTRKLGVQFGPLADDLKAEQYPIEKTKLVEEYGGREIELEDGNQTLGEILGPLGETTFQSGDDVMQGVIGNVSQEAIGRKNYSDRGGMKDEGERDRHSI